jgi:hypothetical protein
MSRLRSLIITIARDSLWCGDTTKLGLNKHMSRLIQKGSHRNMRISTQKEILGISIVLSSSQRGVICESQSRTSSKSVNRPLNLDRGTRSVTARRKRDCPRRRRTRSCPRTSSTSMLSITKMSITGMLTCSRLIQNYPTFSATKTY